MKFILEDRVYSDRRFTDITIAIVKAKTFKKARNKVKKILANLHRKKGLYSEITNDNDDVFEYTIFQTEKMIKTYGRMRNEKIKIL